MSLEELLYNATNFEYETVGSLQNIKLDENKIKTIIKNCNNQYLTYTQCIELINILQQEKDNLNINTLIKLTYKPVDFYPHYKRN